MKLISFIKQIFCNHQWVITKTSDVYTVDRHTSSCYQPRPSAKKYFCIKCGMIVDEIARAEKAFTLAQEQKSKVEKEHGIFYPDVEILDVGIYHKKSSHPKTPPPHPRRR